VVRTVPASADPSASSRRRLRGDSRGHVCSPETRILSPAEVRERFKRVKPLEDVPVAKRGWMLEVLAAVRALNKTHFTNQDLYALEPHFQQLHPENRHVRDKIRQQLQYLAAAGFIEHPGRNEYVLKAVEP
jgi:type II restriction enzyme